MGPSKVVGPDGLNAFFYQHQQAVVRDTVVKFVQDAFQQESFPEEVNATLLMLMPQNEGPKNFSHFDPISLCHIA